MKIKSLVLTLFSFFLFCVLAFRPVSAFAECAARSFQATEDQVISAYIAYYGRIPDSAGLAFWNAELLAQGNLSGIIQSFGTSDEFERRFGGLDNETLINNLYQQAFGRDADAGGLAFYLDELNNERITLQAIALTILTGAQNEDAVIIENRIGVGQDYITRADDEDIELSEEQLQGVLDDVSEAPESAASACATVAGIVQDVVDAQVEDDSVFEQNSCDNGSDANIPIKKTAVLKGISGLAYSSESTASVSGIKKGVQGVTDINGVFEFYEVCGQSSATFFCLGIKKGCTSEQTASGIEINGDSIGARVLGMIIASEGEIDISALIAATYPDADETAVNTISNNVYQLLLTLDDDGNSSNGISLNATIRAEAEVFADDIDFTDDNFDSNQSVINFVTAVTGQSDLVSEQDAEQFQETLPNIQQSYTVSGTATGIAGSVSVQLNGAEEISTASGTFSFSTQLLTGETYQVELTDTPAGQTCQIANNQGTVSNASITNIAIVCQDETGFNVSILVQGASDQVGLSLNGASTEFFSNGIGQFTVQLQNGQTYSVSLITAPNGQSCALSSASGTVSGSDVADIQVNCEDQPSSFTVGGQISGADGQIGLRLNGGIANVFSNGSFVFSSELTNGASYTVTLISSPTGQTCTVNNGTGTISNTDVTDLAITCEDTASLEFSVGGSVSGLNGSLQLSLNGQSTLTLTGNQSFQFPDSLPAGSAYSVQIVSSPSTQECSLSGGSGSISNSDISSVSVTCITPTEQTYAVGGTVSGSNSALTLTLNGNYTVTITNGAFQFPSVLSSGDSFSVVLSNVAGTQQCSISNSTGVIQTANVTSVNVTCVTPANDYDVDVSVSGVTGSVVLSLNSASQITVSNGISSFPVALVDGSSYSVSVATPPDNQVCSVSNGSGQIAGSDVLVSVSCVTIEEPSGFSVSGTVSGAVTGLVIALNSQETLTTSGGSFTFSQLLAEGESYTVSLGSVPQGFSCSVLNGSGVITGANIANVQISCVEQASTFSVGGTVSGPVSGLILGLNGTDTVSAATGAFTFSEQLADGANYSVSVVNVSQDYSCSVSNGSGVVSGANITNIQVVCEQTVSSYAVLVNVSGATQPIELSLNGGSATTTGSGSFQFAELLQDGTSYSVDLLSSGADQSCSLSNSSGVISGGDVTVSIVCEAVNAQFVVGGSISGAITQVPLLLNGQGPSFFSNGGFQFSQTIANGDSYSVTVSQQTEQNCTVSGGQGTVAGGNVTSIQVTCAPTTYSIGGGITTDNGDLVTLSLNGSPETFGNGSFKFSNELKSGESYNVQVFLPPDDQFCSVFNGTGTVSSADIFNISVQCSFSGARRVTPTPPTASE
ncbi:MAG: DUF4214 domain-containing protein [Pseudomonadales bacterium]|nr:DUF4214 domain-containing protein [Pseudomonadales bacterium]